MSGAFPNGQQTAFPNRSYSAFGVGADLHKVTYLDGDGSVWSTFYVQDGRTAPLPANPSLESDYLRFGGWIGDRTNVTRDTWLNADYHTRDGRSYLNIQRNYITNGTHTFYVTKSDTSELTVDWGDGTTSVTTSSGAVALTHAHPNVAKNADPVLYHVAYKITSGSGTYSLGGGTASTRSSDNEYDVLSIWLSDTVVTSAVYEGCRYRNLKYLLAPAMTANGNYGFAYCYSLLSVNCPAMTANGNYGFAYCVSLLSVNCTAMTANGDYGFASCTSLLSASCPAMTTNGASGFSSCTSLLSLIFGTSTPPTLSSQLDGLNQFCVIYVPASSLSLYKSATNLTAYADQMVGV